MLTTKQAWLKIAEGFDDPDIKPHEFCGLGLCSVLNDLYFRLHDITYGQRKLMLARIKEELSEFSDYLFSTTTRKLFFFCKRRSS